MAESLRIQEKSEEAFEVPGKQPTLISRPMIEKIIALGPEGQAYQALHLGFSVAPLIAGADKFFNALTDWEDYLAPVFPRMLGVTPRQFMRGVGAIEIVAGIGVALKPKIFGYVVSGWLGGIIVNLLIRRRYYDVALRDLGLAIGAFSLSRLAAGRDESMEPSK